MAEIEIAIGGHSSPPTCTNNLLIVLTGSDVPQTSDFCGVFDFKSARMEINRIYFIRICFSAFIRPGHCIFPL